MRGERYYIEDPARRERRTEISSISPGNNSCIPWSFLSKNVVMTMPWWVVNLELCDTQPARPWLARFVFTWRWRSLFSHRKITFTDKCCGWFIHKGEIESQFWDKLLVQSQIIRGEVMPGEAERNQQNLHQLLPTRNGKKSGAFEWFYIRNIRFRIPVNPSVYLLTWNIFKISVSGEGEQCFKVCPERNFFIENPGENRRRLFQSEKYLINLLLLFYYVSWELMITFK